ncbi:holin family protein [Aestuariibacter sp. AA17]|uniref:Holin family protein n=1 Tax=Fluctibacter corallii TaxID=2984329 RepID=A0ABT3A3R6_9ALTE|nr:holin family protein [Aestuariibacter sp. AA17]MCV2883319.1 holin family protein [Aestuariibacter sp. AA17]
MGLLTDIFSTGTSSLISSVAKVADQFITTDEERNAFKVQMAALIQKRESEIEQTLRSEQRAKQAILSAELNQDDKFTKRARPMLVYFGLLMIATNYMVFPILSRFLDVSSTPLPSLPMEFWAGWSGIVATWCIGRSAEKIGATNKVTRLVTGKKSSEVVG